MLNGWVYEGDGGAFVFAGKLKDKDEPDRLFEKRLREPAGVERLPHRLPLEALHGFHARLAPGAALGHALERFKGMEPVPLQRPVPELYRGDQLAPPR